MSSEGSSAKARAHHVSRNEDSTTVSATGCRTHHPTERSTPHLIALILFRRHPERSRSSGGAKDLPQRCCAPREIPRLAGESAGLRDDAIIEIGHAVGDKLKCPVLVTSEMSGLG